jgi:hypothetical protein
MPVRDVLPVILLVLNSFLLPILLSCGIYIKLIFKKKKLFENKVEDATTVLHLARQLENQQKENSSTVQDVVGNDHNSKVEVCVQTITKTFENGQKIDEKVMAQVSSAERSMKTNVVLATVFIIVMSFSIFVADQWRNHFYVIVLMSIRALMPILTAIANFGTVKNVALQYWNKL